MTSFPGSQTMDASHPRAGSRPGLRVLRSSVYVAAGTALLTALAALPGAAQQGTTAATCASCHQDLDLRSKANFTHGDAESCSTCHHIGFTNIPQESEARRLESCAGCHQDVEMSPGHRPSSGGADANCLACHTLHAGPEPGSAAQAMSAGCTSCHAWGETRHAAAHGYDVTCAQCHTAHPQTGESLALHETAAGQASDAEFALSTVTQCVACHDEGLGAHGSRPESLPTCATCHDFQAADPASLLEPAAVSETCGSCHEDVHPGHPPVEEGDGPVCADCHDPHGSAVGPDAGHQISLRCGACHEDEAAAFRRGGHSAGLSMSGLDRDVPDCTTCHESHLAPDQPMSNARMLGTARCLECHSDPVLAETYGMPALTGKSYEDDFHGQTLKFIAQHEGAAGPVDVMVCSDCHGAHDVSWVETADVTEVCLSCHEKAGKAIVGAWLGHEPIGPRNKPIIFAAYVFYAIFIPLVLGGLIINILFHLRDQRRKGARIHRADGTRRLLARIRGKNLPRVPTVVRFSKIQRMEHLGSMVTFILLVVTGLPQIYPDSALGSALVAMFGGIRWTRYIHRTIGVIFVLLMVMHLVRGISEAIIRRRIPSIAPEPKDFRDAMAVLKHHIWGTPRPKIKKYAFDQKFEYWGLFLGGVIMSSTGLILLFPELVTQVLPGILVAAAKVVHGLEGTFAVLVVVVWHSWGVILRPEIFPLDTTIFTGRISVERLKDEHALEYERIFGEEVDVDEGHGPRTPPTGVLAGTAGAMPAD